MKKLLILLIATVSISQSQATEDLFLHNIDNSYDDSASRMLDNAYVAVELHAPIIPNDLSVALGYEFADGLVEAELYVSARLARFFTDEHDLHVPIGARIRIPLNGRRTIFLEYQREFTVLNNNENGLLETPNLISVIKRFEGSDMYVGCGVGNKVHHAWADEDHAPEKGGYVECKIGKKF